MAVEILLVRCETDQTQFETIPRPSYINPTREFVIECPTCRRGYLGDVKGGFWSGRELKIIARAVVDPFKIDPILVEGEGHGGNTER